MRNKSKIIAAIFAIIAVFVLYNVCQPFIAPMIYKNNCNKNSANLIVSKPTKDNNTNKIEKKSSTPEENNKSFEAKSVIEKLSEVPDPKNNQVFTDICFRTQDKHNRDIKIEAQKILEEKDGLFTLRNMKVSFISSENSPSTIFSEKALIKDKNKTIYDLTGGVKFAVEKNGEILSDSAHVDVNLNTILGNQKIQIKQNNCTVTADKYEYNFAKRILKLNGTTVGKLQNNTIFADQLDIVFSQNTPMQISSMKASGKQIQIIAKNYSINANNEISFASNKISTNNNVTLLYNINGTKYTIKSKEMYALLNKQGLLSEINAIKNVNIVINKSKTYDIQANKVKAIIKNSEIYKTIANENVIIKSNNVTVRANNCEMVANKIFANGNVIIVNEKGTILGENAILDTITQHISIKNSNGIIKNAK